MVGLDLKYQWDNGFGNRPQKENLIVDSFNAYRLWCADGGDIMGADKWDIDKTSGYNRHSLAAVRLLPISGIGHDDTPTEEVCV